MWDVLYLPDPLNHRNNWVLLLNKSLCLLYCMKFHVKSLKGGYKSYQCMIQNLVWLGVYLMITFSNDLLQKVLKMVTTAVNVP